VPIYTYVCKDCSEKFDLLVGVTLQQDELKCKKCGSKSIQKALGSFSVRNPGGEINSSGPSCPSGTCPTGF
jgi:putative FmdB family regulatory protein